MGRENLQSKNGASSQSKQDRIARLQRRKERGESLLSQRPINDKVFRTWLNGARKDIQIAFGNDTSHANSLSDCSGAVYTETTEEFEETCRFEDLENNTKLLTALIDEIKDEAEHYSTADESSPEVSQDSLDIFISHSSADKALASALIDLLRTSMNIPAARIRCTSVDGNRLPLAAATENVLRNEIGTARVFIGLLTPVSIKSIYVLLEVGARWGQGKYLATLLAGGAEASLLKGPLAGLNALYLSETAQVHQLVTDLSSELGLPPENPAAYERQLEKVVSLSRLSTSAEPIYAANHKASLEIELPNPTTIDLQLLRWRLIVKLRNLNPKTTIKNAKVWLTKIEWNAEATWKKPINLKQVNFPLLLPVQGSLNAVSGVEIAPSPFEQAFDMFYVGGDAPAYRVIGIAPFIPFAKSPFNLTRECLDRRRQDGTLPDMPMEKYYNTQSSVCEFQAMNSQGLETRVKITFQVTADEMRTIEKTATLILPASCNEKGHYHPPFWKAVEL